MINVSLVVISELNISDLFQEFYSLLVARFYYLSLTFRYCDPLKQYIVKTQTYGERGTGHKKSHGVHNTEYYIRKRVRRTR